MTYALNLAEDGRVLSVTFEEFAVEGMPIVDNIPEGDVSQYRYENGEFVYDPVPVKEVEELPTQLDRIESQIAYLAMMTGNSDILEV